MLKLLIVLATLASVAVEMPPCEYEDSTNCYWNAKERGNGFGHSFVSINGRSYFLD
jgi:hypothetical protein